MTTISRTAAYGALLAGVIGVVATTGAVSAAVPTIELASSGGGLYSYTFSVWII